MNWTGRTRLVAALAALVPVCLVAAQATLAQDAPAATKPALSVTIGFVTRRLPAVEPLSLAEPVVRDDGVRGAEQGIVDNATTGRFLNQEFRLQTHEVAEKGDLAAAFQAALDTGERLFVADLPAADLKTVAPMAERAGAILINSRATDDELRADDCSKAVFHTIPSRAMKADALAQYLAWKRWTRWFLLTGSHPADRAMADAFRRSAQKFGMKVVEDRVYEDKGGSRRTDTGHVQVQAQMPIVTQDAREHDVIVVADESEVFGDYVPYRTWDARPVVGTSGLVPTSWSRVFEQWGGTQMQRRFERLAKRPMTERDYAAWVAVRAIGEAVTRTSTADASVLRDYMASTKLEVAAFKGQALSFRRWDHQLRQPILLVTPRTLVSVSPQDQFLHQHTPLDTLGLDEPESRCRLDP